MKRAFKQFKGYIVIAGVFAVIITCLIALNVSFRRAIQTEMAEQFNKQQLLLANAASSGIQEYVNSMESEILSSAGMASSFHIRNETDFVKLTKGIFRDAGDVKKAVRLLDNEGGVLYERGTMAAEGPDNKDIIVMAKRLCPGNTLIKQDTGALHLIAPVCSSDKLTGSIVVSIDIRDIAKRFLVPIKSGLRGYAWMMDDKGDLLHHPTQPDMVGRNLYKTNSSCFRCHKSFDVERRIIEGKGDYYGRYIAPSGEDKVLAFSTSTVGNSRWIVAVSAPYSEVIMAIQGSMKFYSWLVVSLFFITGFVSVVFMLFYRKKMRAEELERHQSELESHAKNLEDDVAKRTEELLDEQEKLNTIVSAIGSGMVLFDTQGKIQWVNQAMTKMAGKDITGMLCENICGNCTVLSSCTVEDVQTEILTNLFNKKDRYYQMTTAPVKAANGEISGHIRLVQDVTEMKKMEQQMMHSEKLASLSRLTSGIAHEMASSPTSVFSFVQVLKEMEQDEFKRESLETTYFHMKRIADTLKRLSGFSMTPPENIVPCKVNSLIDSSLSLIQYDSRSKDITIVRDLKSDLPEILADENQLSQVIVNLILNAVDAMQQGGTLTIRTSLKNNSVVVLFEDTGVGIPSENIDKIFDPFYSTKEKGTGLGLAVSYGIVRKFNGNLTVESEENRGSKFVMTFPAYRAG